MPLTFITEQNNKGAQQLKLLGAFLFIQATLILLSYALFL